MDLSLFRDESQLKKRKSLKRTSKRKENTSGAEDGYEGLTGDDESDEEVKKKKPKTNKRMEKPKVSVKEKVKTKEKPVEKRAERTSERGRDRGLASKRRSESVVAAAAVKNAAVKQTVAKHAAVRQAASKAPEKKPKVVVKPTKKPEPVAESSIPTRSTKTRSKHFPHLVSTYCFPFFFTFHHLPLELGIAESLWWIMYVYFSNTIQEC